MNTGCEGWRPFGKSTAAVGAVAGARHSSHKDAGKIAAVAAAVAIDGLMEKNIRRRDNNV